MYFSLKDNILILQSGPLYYLTNVLIVGSGGREHALGWKLSQSNDIKKIFFAPGNAGTCQNVRIQALEIDKLKVLAEQNDCFTIIGTECPLAKGIADSSLEDQHEILGPTQQASLLESSKIYAKQF